MRACVRAHTREQYPRQHFWRIRPLIAYVYVSIPIPLLPFLPIQLAGRYKAIIVSGGPQSVYGADAPKFDARLFTVGVPILGICYGMQLMNAVHGGSVEKKAVREDGQFGIVVRAPESLLFRGLGASMKVQFCARWMRHCLHS